MSEAPNNHSPNLSTRPPRSARVRLGGYVILARIVDKGRAEIAGTAGEYKYNNPMDHHFFRFTGITAETLKKNSPPAKETAKSSHGSSRTRHSSARRGKSSNGARG